MKIDASRYPNVTDIFRVDWRAIEADVGPRHFKVTVFEKLGDPEPPPFFATFDEKIRVEIDQVDRPLWVGTDLPPEEGDSPEDCVTAALGRLNELG